MLIYFFTWGGYFSVEPQQAVIVMRFGRIQQHFTSGGHWFLPYPVNRFVRVRVNQQQLDVSFTPAPALEGSSAEPSLEPGRDSYLLTGDANIIHTSWRISFQVSNPAKYYESLATPTDPMADDVAETDVNGFVYARGPQTMIRNLFRRAVIQVTSTQKAAEILKKYDKKEWQQVIADGTFPEPLSLHENIEYVRSVLKNTVQYTAVGEEYENVDNLPERAPFFAFQKKINPSPKDTPSHMVIGSYIGKNKKDYRWCTKPNPVKELQDTSADNTDVGRTPGAAKSAGFAHIRRV